MNYAQLKADVLSWMARDDVPTASVIQNAEAEIRREVRVLAQEGIVTGSLSGGAFAVPADFLDSRQLLIDGRGYTFTSPSRYQSEQDMQAKVRLFTRVGASFLVVGGGSEAYSLTYRASFPALSADTDTNWLLDNAVDVYLYGSLKHAAVWAKDVTAAQGYDALFKAAVERVNQSDRAAQFAGPLVARVRGAR